MTRRRKSKPKPKLCPIWPRCRCIVQGYVNQREGGEWSPPCGRKPRALEQKP